MSLPASTIVIGEDPVAQAICQVLELFGIQCYKYSAVPDGGSNSDFTKHLNGSDLAIAIAPSADRVITQVHQLRSVDPYHWAGNFIAVVNEQAQKEELLTKSLFGQPNYKLYSQDQWHKAISLYPSQFVTQLFLTIVQFSNFPLSESQKLNPYDWDTWLSQSNIRNLHQKLKEVRQEDNMETKISLLMEVVSLVKKIDWIPFVTHEDLRKVVDPLNDFNEVNSGNYRSVLVKLERLLSSSLI